MILNIYIDDTINDAEVNEELKNTYINASIKHNNHINNTEYYDAGFDLFTTENIHYKDIDKENNFVKINFGIKCSAYIININSETIGNVTHPTAYYLYPRSSISKTPLRMANGTGIIDSGYRGHIIGAFDIKKTITTDTNKLILDNQSPLIAQKYNRLTQICAPNLIPIIVNVVDYEEELGETTERGTGGFGSTGGVN
jgi:dUTP pyrophosphatase